jgi:hypothetical protein
MAAIHASSRIAAPQAEAAAAEPPPRTVAFNYAPMALTGYRRQYS